MQAYFFHHSNDKYGDSPFQFYHSGAVYGPRQDKQTGNFCSIDIS